MKRGFTLAEVLITLGIIGVVAAITIPNLMTHFQQEQTVTKLKKAYSVINQAYKSSLMKSESPKTLLLLGQTNILKYIGLLILKFYHIVKLLKVVDINQTVRLNL